MMTSFYGMKAVVAACLVLAFAIVHVDAYRAQQDYINTKYAHCPPCPRPARANKHTQPQHTRKYLGCIGIDPKRSCFLAVSRSLPRASLRCVLTAATTRSTTS